MEKVSKVKGHPVMIGKGKLQKFQGFNHVHTCLFVCLFQHSGVSFSTSEVKLIYKLGNIILETSLLILFSSDVVEGIRKKVCTDSSTTK